MVLTRIFPASLISTLNLLNAFLLPRQLLTFVPFALPHHLILRPYASIRLDRLSPRGIIIEVEIEESFPQGSGPGGQKDKQNLVCCATQTFPTGIFVKCHVTRSRAQNRKSVRKLLAEKLEQLEMGDQRRMALRAELERRKRRGRKKKARENYGKRGDLGIGVDEKEEQDGVQAKIEKENADGIVARDTTRQTHQEPRLPYLPQRF